MAVLLGARGELGGIGAIYILYLALFLAAFGEIGVAEDREEPGLEVRSLLERTEIVPSLVQRFLNQIVGSLAVAQSEEEIEGVMLALLSEEPEAEQSRPTSRRGSF